MGDDFFVGEFVLVAVGLFFVLGFLLFVMVGGVVIGDEVFEVFVVYGFFFEGMVDVGMVVVYLYFFCLGIRGGFVVFEKEDVCFDIVGVEDVGG